MISSPTVRLRAMERADLPSFVSWLNDPEVILNLELFMPMSSLDEDAWFDEQMKIEKEQRPLAVDALVAPETPAAPEAQAEKSWTLIGNGGLFDIRWRARSAELGIAIGDKRYWNQGFGTQTMRLLVDHGFGMLNLNRIYLRVVSTNARAIRVYEKVGFVHEGCQRQADFKNGHYVDVLMMSILRSEWESTR